MLGNTADILGVVSNTFASFKGIIFLLIGVFLALYLFEKLVDFFLTLPQFAKDMSLSKTEKSEIALFVKMAKKRGVDLNRKELEKKFKKQKEEKIYKKLSKKYL
ncbi:MAG: hypothetical protein PHO28_03930 [Candidatus Pacebacteria bacterium]|nr:hypothetical protein [Candidatus Paceibacterota bacterium]